MIYGMLILDMLAILLFLYEIKMVIFILPHCCRLLHYVTRVKLQKTIACLILVMNDARLTCWILFIAIFGVPPPLNQLQDLFIMCYSLIKFPTLLGFTL